MLQDCVCTTKHLSSFNRLEVYGRQRMHEEKRSSVEVANVNCPDIEPVAMWPKITVHQSQRGTEVSGIVSLLEKRDVTLTGRNN